MQLKSQYSFITPENKGRRCTAWAHASITQPIIYTTGQQHGRAAKAQASGMSLTTVTSQGAARIMKSQKLPSKYPARRPAPVAPVHRQTAGNQHCAWLRNSKHSH